jgi:hypothetical protein
MLCYVMLKNFDLFISISFTAVFILKFMGTAIQKYRGQCTFLYRAYYAMGVVSVYPMRY